MHADTIAVSSATRTHVNAAARPAKKGPRTGTVDFVAGEGALSVLSHLPATLLPTLSSAHERRQRQRGRVSDGIQTALNTV